jgi:hypothetical protein
MKEIRKNAGGVRAEMGRVPLSLIKCGGKSAAEETELMIDEIHRRATEVGPVLEGILHIHCEENVRLWN